MCVVIRVFYVFRVFRECFVCWDRPLVVVVVVVSQSVFINGDIYRINKLTTTDKALYRFYVADKSVPPIYLRELS